MDLTSKDIGMLPIERGCHGGVASISVADRLNISACVNLETLVIKMTRDTACDRIIVN
jgi:hypothetical protein